MKAEPTTHPGHKVARMSGVQRTAIEKRPLYLSLKFFPKIKTAVHP